MLDPTSGEISGFSTLVEPIPAGLDYYFLQPNPSHLIQNDAKSTEFLQHKFGPGPLLCGWHIYEKYISSDVESDEDDVVEDSKETSGLEIWQLDVEGQSWRRLSIDAAMLKAIEGDTCLEVATIVKKRINTDEGGTSKCGEIGTGIQLHAWGFCSGSARTPAGKFMNAHYIGDVHREGAADTAVVTMVEDGESPVVNTAESNVMMEDGCLMYMPVSDLDDNSDKSDLASLFGD